MNDLPTKLKNALRRVEIPPEIVAIYLYGSGARGRLREESDLDFALLSAPALPDGLLLKRMAEVEEILSRVLTRLGVTRSLSLFPMRSRSASILLLFSIVAEGVVIYEAKGGRVQRRAFENMVTREYYDFLPYFLEAAEKRYARAKKS